MPRKARIVSGGVCYHVINRGNERARVFHCDEDYRYFLFALLKAQQHLKLDLLAACLMPNHVHLVLRPVRTGDLSKWMQRLMTAHVRWHHARHQTAGRVWQGRYKLFPIQQDRHLLAVLRYVERNALRAGLVDRAEQWPWGSLAWRCCEWRRVVSVSPVPLGERWMDIVNTPQTPAELAALRACVNRQRPYGADDWVKSTAKALNLTPGLNSRGRPRKAAVSEPPESLDLFTGLGLRKM
jgi:putative transposase